MQMFPKGCFYILSRKHGFALDVYDGGTAEGTNLIVWPQKFSDSDNQLWSFENGRLTNKKSGHVMDISSSAFKKDKTIVQKKRKNDKQSQEWIYDQGFICSKEYPSLVLDIRGDSPKGGAQVLLYKRKDTDNLNQLWQFEPYQQFEHALNMVTTTLPLHKKEGFGQPSLGYAAEIGVPPDLKTISENNKIAGVGNNVSATPTNNNAGGVDHSRIDPALAQYGSFYGGTPTAPAPAQPDHQANFPPPPPSKSSSDLYPPPAQPGTVPSPSSGYPPNNANAGYPSPSNNNNSGYPAPPSAGYPSSSSGYPALSPSGYQQQGAHPAPPSYPGPSGNAYPPQQQGYPPAPSSSSGYPPAPPSPSNYVNNNSGYPSTITSPPPGPGYPPTSYPPTNTNTGYPSPSNFPPSNDYYPPQQPGGMPSSTNYGGYPPATSNNAYPPPPLPGNHPNQQQDQYGYPSYPQ